MQAETGVTSSHSADKEPWVELEGPTHFQIPLVMILTPLSLSGGKDLPGQLSWDPDGKKSVRDWAHEEELPPNSEASLLS